MAMKPVMSETPSVMLAKVIGLAETDDNVAAIGVEGSLNNPTAVTDAWQDLDVTLFVHQVRPALAQPYLALFGTPTIVQHLHEPGLFGGGDEYWETFLTRYPGTQRMDLKLAPASVVQAYLDDDQLNAIVWRRGSGRITPRPTSAASHWLAIPKQAEFAAHVNEFYWIAGYVVKGLARGNLIYAAEHFAQNLRPELLWLLACQETLARHGQFDPGVHDKNLWDVLPDTVRGELMATYDLHDGAAIRQSLKTAVAIYGRVLAEITRSDPLQKPAWVPRAVEQIDSWLT